MLRPSIDGNRLPKGDQMLRRFIAFLALLFVAQTQGQASLLLTSDVANSSDGIQTTFSAAGTLTTDTLNHQETLDIVLTNTTSANPGGSLTGLALVVFVSTMS